MRLKYAILVNKIVERVVCAEKQENGERNVACD